MAYRSKAVLAALRDPGTVKLEHSEARLRQPSDADWLFAARERDRDC
jgi:hypothetical protein